MFSRFNLIVLSFILGLFSSSSFAFKPALSEDDSKRLAQCMEKQSKACDQADEKTKCRMEAFKKMDRGCQKLLGKAHQSLLPMGMACYGLLKVCPFPGGQEEEAMKKFGECVQKNMSKMPPACKGMMESMTKGMTGGKHNFQETSQHVEKNAGNNVKVETKK